MSTKIAHGDPEPPQTSRLLDEDGYLWWWRQGLGWQYAIDGDPVYPYAWHEIPEAYFPMGVTA